jgi:predicted RNase H-like HicB family nuclease
VRVIYHHEADGWWAESPDVEGWLAVGGTYAEVAKLAQDGVPFALGQDAELEHYVPAGEHVAAACHLKIEQLSASARPPTSLRFSPCGERRRLCRLRRTPSRRSGGEERLQALGAVRLSAIVASDEGAAMSLWTAAGYERQSDRSRFVKILGE